MCGNICPNCIIFGEISLSVVSLTLSVTESGCSNRLRTTRGWCCSWGTAMMRESLSLSPKIRTLSDAGRRILKPSFNLCYISPRMNPIIYGVHSDTCGTFLMAFSRAALDKGGPVLTGMPYSTYCCRRGAAGWETVAKSVLDAPCCCKTMKEIR